MYITFAGTGDVSFPAVHSQFLCICTLFSNDILSQNKLNFNIHSHFLCICTDLSHARCFLNPVSPNCDRNETGMTKSGPLLKIQTYCCLHKQAGPRFRVCLFFRWSYCTITLLHSRILQKSFIARTSGAAGGYWRNPSDRG